jgi:hypothetical protein
VTFIVCKGSSFLAPSGPRDGMHMHVVLTDADKDGFHLLATISTIRNETNYDATCEIEAGEHEFITARSYVLFKLANTMRGSHIVNMINKRLYVPKDDVSEGLFARICDGVGKSEFTPGRVLKYYNASLILPPPPEGLAIRLHLIASDYSCASLCLSPRLHFFVRIRALSRRKFAIREFDATRAEATTKGGHCVVNAGTDGEAFLAERQNEPPKKPGVPSTPCTHPRYPGATPSSNHPNFSLALRVTSALGVLLGGNLSRQ